MEKNTKFNTLLSPTAQLQTSSPFISNNSQIANINKATAEQQPNQFNSRSTSNPKANTNQMIQNQIIARQAPPLQKQQQTNTIFSEQEQIVQNVQSNEIQQKSYAEKRNNFLSLRSPTQVHKTQSKTQSNQFNTQQQCSQSQQQQQTSQIQNQSLKNNGLTNSIKQPKFRADSPMYGHRTPKSTKKIVIPGSNATATVNQRASQTLKPNNAVNQPVSSVTVNNSTKKGIPLPTKPGNNSSQLINKNSKNENEPNSRTQANNIMKEITNYKLSQVQKQLQNNNYVQENNTFQNTLNQQKVNNNANAKVYQSLDFNNDSKLANNMQQLVYASNQIQDKTGNARANHNYSSSSSAKKEMLTSNLNLNQNNKKPASTSIPPPRNMAVQSNQSSANNINNSKAATNIRLLKQSSKNIPSSTNSASFDTIQKTEFGLKRPDSAGPQLYQQNNQNAASKPYSNNLSFQQNENKLSPKKQYQNLMVNMKAQMKQDYMTSNEKNTFQQQLKQQELISNVANTNNANKVNQNYSTRKESNLLSNNGSNNSYKPDRMKYLSQGDKKI